MCPLSGAHIKWRLNGCHCAVWRSSALSQWCLCTTCWPGDGAEPGSQPASAEGRVQGERARGLCPWSLLSKGSVPARVGWSGTSRDASVGEGAGMGAQGELGRPTEVHQPQQESFRGEGTGKVSIKRPSQALPAWSPPWVLLWRCSACYLWDWACPSDARGDKEPDRSSLSPDHLPFSMPVFSSAPSSSCLAPVCSKGPR